MWFASTILDDGQDSCRSPPLNDALRSACRRDAECAGYLFYQRASHAFNRTWAPSWRTFGLSALRLTRPKFEFCNFKNWRRNHAFTSMVAVKVRKDSVDVINSALARFLA